LKITIHASETDDQLQHQPSTPSSNNSSNSSNVETDDFEDLTPRSQYYRNNPGGNNQVTRFTHDGSSTVDSDDSDLDVEAHNNKLKTLAITSNDFDDLNSDDINEKLHNRYLPNWCHCVVSDYLNNSIRRTGFQLPLDDRQIFVAVLLLASFILSILTWFLVEPDPFLRGMFGAFWVVCVVVIIFSWLFTSMIETQAYKLTNIPSNVEELKKLDQRLYEQGMAKFDQIRKEQEEYEAQLEQENGKNNTFSFSTPTRPGTHHDLAGFVPIRDTQHDLMTSSWFCCYRGRYRPNKYSQGNRAVKKYIEENDIPQQRLPFWISPLSYYMKLFGDMKTTVQYIKQQELLEKQYQEQLENIQNQAQNQPALNNQAKNPSSNPPYMPHTPLGPQNTPRSLHRGSLVLAPNAVPLNSSNSMIGGPELSRRMSNVSQESKGFDRQVRVASVAPSANRNQYNFNDTGSVFGDNTDTHSVISTLSVSRRKQLLISPNNFNIDTKGRKVGANNNYPTNNHNNHNNNHNNNNIPNNTSTHSTNDQTVNQDDGSNNSHQTPRRDLFGKKNTKITIHSANNGNQNTPQTTPTATSVNEERLKKLSRPMKATTDQVGRGRLPRKHSAFEASQEDTIEPEYTEADDNLEIIDDEDYYSGPNSGPKLSNRSQSPKLSNNRSESPLNALNSINLSSDEENGRVSTIQPLMSFNNLNFNPNNNNNNRNYNPRLTSFNYDNDDTSSLSSNHSVSFNVRPGSYNQRSQSSTPRQQRNYSTTLTLPSSTNNSIDDNHRGVQKTPSRDQSRGYSTLQPNEMGNEFNTISPMNQQSTPRGAPSDLKNRSHSTVSRQHFRFNDGVAVATHPFEPLITPTSAMMITDGNHINDGTLSYRTTTDHHVMILKGVDDAIKKGDGKGGQDVGQIGKAEPNGVQSTAMHIIQSHELPTATGTYQYEDVIIDTQQQLVPMEVTTWWPHHLLSLFEIYQLTGIYFKSHRKRMEYDELIEKYEHYRQRAYAGSLKFSKISAAPEHVFVGVSNELRLNSRSGAQGAIGGERGYFNDEVCVMKEGELVMNYFNHFNNIISLPFHVGYFGNVSSPHEPGVETPIPLFGVGVKESRPLQQTLIKEYRQSQDPSQPMSPNHGVISDVQNATTIVVVDEGVVAANNQCGTSELTWNTQQSSLEFDGDGSMMVTGHDSNQRNRTLHHDVSFSQYTYVPEKNAKRNSVQPVAVHNRRTQYDSIVLDPKNRSNSLYLSPQLTKQSYMLATESFMRDGSQPVLRALDNTVKDNNNQQSSPTTPATSTAAPQSTHDVNGPRSKIGARTAALTYVHPNQVTMQLKNKKLPSEIATIQQRLYINTKRGPLVCIDEPHHCNKQENSRGIVVASANCTVDFTSIPLVCTDCRIIQHPTMLHCTICNKCQENFDHHCPYLNTCIGERNYHVFFTLVMFVTLFTILNCFLSIRTLLLSFNVNFFDTSSKIFDNSNHRYDGVLYGTAWVPLLLLSALGIIVNIVGIGAFGSLLAVHLYISFRGETTRGMLARWKEEKKVKNAALLEKERALEDKRRQKELERGIELQRQQEILKRGSQKHPLWKPTKRGVSLSVKFHIDIEKDQQTLDQFLTQPRRQTIYSPVMSGVVPLGTKPEEFATVVGSGVEGEDNKQVVVEILEGEDGERAEKV
jgi:hypothetical protein